MADGIWNSGFLQALCFGRFGREVFDSMHLHRQGRLYESLNMNKDFRRLYARGKSKIHPVLVIYYMKNRAGHCRMGITASKKIGNAVIRNRARRVIKEAFRQIAPEIKSGWDFVFVARGRTAHVKSTQVYKVMCGQFRSAGLLRDRDSS